MNTYQLSQSRTLQKCQKILSLFEQLQPRKFKEAIDCNDLKHRFYIHKNSSQRKSILRNSQTPNSKSQKHKFSCSSNKSISRSINTSQSFASSYKKQSRFDKIMKIKVKSIKKPQKGSSSKDLVKNYQSEQNKQNNRKQPLSRFQKIMQIKIQKPNVNSTLSKYQPPVNHSKSKESIASKDQSKSKEFKQLRQIKKNLKKSQKQIEKQNRLWKIFQRERDIRVRQQKKKQLKQLQQKRRKQLKFQSLIEKQLKKIQLEKQILKRKNEGFSQYIFPAY